MEIVEKHISQKDSINVDKNISETVVDQDSIAQLPKQIQDPKKFLPKLRQFSPTLQRKEFKLESIYGEYRLLDADTLIQKNDSLENQIMKICKELEIEYDFEKNGFNSFVFRKGKKLLGLVVNTMPDDNHIFSLDLCFGFNKNHHSRILQLAETHCNIIKLIEFAFLDNKTC